MDTLSYTFPMLFLLLIAIVVTSGFFWYVERRNREIRLRNNEFVGMLISAFANKAIKDASDLIAFYESFFGTAHQRIRMYSDIHLFLEKAQSKISSTHAGSGEYKLINRLDEFRQLSHSILGLLREEEKRVPFYGTPDLERSVLEDILELTASDKELVSAKLARLAELIKARQETVDILGEEKGEARKLAYWGLAGSVVFGVASLILGIMQYIQAIGGSP